MAIQNRKPDRSVSEHDPPDPEIPDPSSIGSTLSLWQTPRSLLHYRVTMQPSNSSCQNHNTGLEPPVGDSIAEQQALIAALNLANAKVEQQAQQAALINPIVRAMRSTLVLDEMLQITVDRLHEVLKVSGCLIFRHDPGKSIKSHYVSAATVERDRLIGIDCDLCQHHQAQLAAGVPVVLCEIDAIDAPEIKESAQKCGIYSILIIPLLHQQKYLGGISFYQCDRSRDWTADLVLFGETIADHCSIGIVQAEQYQKLQNDLIDRQRIEENLLQTTSELLAIFQASPDFYLRLDAEGKILGYQAERPSHLYFPPHVFLQQRIQDIFPPEVGQQWQAAILQVLTTNSLATLEYILQLPVGEKTFEARLLPSLERQIIVMIRDLSERKQAEKALREANQTFEALIENTRDAVWSIDADYRILTLNSACRQHFRMAFGIELMVGTNIIDCLPCEVQTAWRNYYNRALQGERFEIQEPYCLAGISLEIAFAFNPIITEQGQITGVSVFSKNITDRKLLISALRETNEKLEIKVENRTAKLIDANEQLKQQIIERKRMEEALKESEERFRNLVETTNDWVWEVDENAVYTYVSPKVNDLLGYEPEEVLGKTLFDFMRPEEAARVANIFQSLKTSQKSFTCLETTNRHKEGYLVVLESNGAAFFDCEGQFKGYRGMHRDISDRKHREERLRLLESVVVNANDGILITEAEPINEPGPRILYANQAFTRMTGYSLEELLGKTPRILQGPKTDRTQLEKIRTALLNWQSVTVELMNHRKDGSEFWVELNIAPVSNETGWYTHWIAVQRDITDRKQAEAEVHKALETEKELNELRSRFVSMTSHEFRTPLTTILSSAELLEHYGYKWSEDKKREHLHRIQESVNHMTSLLNYILVIGKAEAGKLDFKPAPLDIKKFCQNLVEELQLSAAKGQVIRFVFQDCPGEERLGIQEAVIKTFCNMDAQLLRHIFSNLLSNALKYSPESSNINFILSFKNETAVFQVKDAGIGIPTEDRQRLFESFHRARNVGNIPGTGLGLSVVKKCVDLHGGQISVESEVGVGTTFTVTLPLNS